jgi:stage V sporulation protein R
MSYEQLAKSHEYGLSTIYELVINNNPAVAYLLEGNSIIDQKLVIAHVLGHVDFFKNNFAFAVTDQGKDARTGQPIRKWIDTMANHGAVVRRWANRIGIERVEEFVDTCLSLENLVDPYKPFSPAPERRDETDEELNKPAEEVARLRVDRSYMESYINPEAFIEEQKKRIEADAASARKFPETADRDVLGFLLEHAPLERWQRDILGIIRTEAYYFAPQMQTKIMNEGWATYWHSRLLTEKVLEASEIVRWGGGPHCLSLPLEREP